MISAFMQRSRQGVKALGASLGRGALEPERAAYVVVTGVNIASALARAKTGGDMTKPLLMPLLSGRVLRSGRSDSALGLIALAGGWAGDVALMKPNNIHQGAAGFALNHAAYAALLFRRGARPSIPRGAIRGIVLLGATALAASKKPSLLRVVLGYGCAVATTSMLCDDQLLLKSDDAFSWGIGHGGNLFLISDAMLFARETLIPETSALMPLANAAVMSTYSIAQLLIIDGLFPNK